MYFLRAVSRPSSSRVARLPPALHHRRYATDWNSWEVNSWKDFAEWPQEKVRDWVHSEFKMNAEDASKLKDGKGNPSLPSPPFVSSLRPPSSISLFHLLLRAGVVLDEQGEPIKTGALPGIREQPIGRSFPNSETLRYVFQTCLVLRIS
jgi:hypothetical protein